MSTTRLHYFRKIDIDFSRLTGAKVPTLCGRAQPVLPVENSTAGNGQSLPICAECSEDYQLIPISAERKVKA